MTLKEWHENRKDELSKELLYYNHKLKSEQLKLSRYIKQEKDIELIAIQCAVVDDIRHKVDFLQNENIINNRELLRMEKFGYYD